MRPLKEAKCSGCQPSRLERLGLAPKSTSCLHQETSRPERGGEKDTRILRSFVKQKEKEKREVSTSENHMEPILFISTRAKTQRKRIVKYVYCKGGSTKSSKWKQRAN